MGKDKANKNIISGGWNEWTMVYRPPLIIFLTKNWRSLRSATGHPDKKLRFAHCFLQCKVGDYCKKKQKKQVEPAFAGWNEWTRTTDPHLIRTFCHNFNIKNSILTILFFILIVKKLNFF